MWRSVGCRVQGVGHKKLEIPCQDNIYEATINGINVIALSDGAGSARLSHFGSACVVSTAAHLIAESFDSIYDSENALAVKEFLILNLLRQLRLEAAIRECEVNDLAATLLLVAVKGDHYIVVHLGDGVIGYLDGNELKVATTPDNGEFANVTIFVTSDNAVSSLRLMKGELKEKSAFVLMSDGTEQSLYHKPTKTLAAIVKKIMHRTCYISKEMVKQQLESSFTNVISKQTQDDCSIVFLVKPSNALYPIEKMSFAERCELYKLSSDNPRRVFNTDHIIARCSTPTSIRNLSVQMKCDPRFIRPYIYWLVELGLLVKIDEYLYQRVV